MKTVILAGGLGTRLAEETATRPKPMVTVGGKPLLWHLMKIYSSYGHRDFVLALGYRADVVKEYLLHLHALSASFEIDLGTGKLTTISDVEREDWRVAALDTGLKTQTGGRIKRAIAYVDEDSIMATYGDGLADIDIGRLLDFHRSHGRLATVTAVRPPARFGRLHLDGSQVSGFGEKPQGGEGWINGGFFVFNRGVADYIDNDDQPLELDPMMRLVANDQLMAFRHEGFWQPMDTLRERQDLESLWHNGTAPWRTWE